VTVYVMTSRAPHEAGRATIGLPGPFHVVPGHYRAFGGDWVASAPASTRSRFAASIVPITMSRCCMSISPRNLKYFRCFTTKHKYVPKRNRIGLTSSA
jgi:hypothetical protein